MIIFSTSNVPPQTSDGKRCEEFRPLSPDPLELSHVSEKVPSSSLLLELNLPPDPLLLGHAVEHLLLDSGHRLPSPGHGALLLPPASRPPSYQPRTEPPLLPLLGQSCLSARFPGDAAVGRGVAG